VLIVSTCQPEPGLQMVAKWEAGSSGLPTATTRASMLVGQGVEDRLWHTAGLVDDHQHIASVDALERRRVVVRRLAGVRDELLADVPLRIERDPAWQSCFPWATPMYRQMIPSTCGVVGAVVTTNASPGGCASIHK
jgi:hypothetical protein